MVDVALITSFHKQTGNPVTNAKPNRNAHAIDTMNKNDGNHTNERNKSNKNTDTSASGMMRNTPNQNTHIIDTMYINRCVPTT